MKKFLMGMMFSVLAVILNASAYAADDPNEAISMVKKAVALIKEAGKDKALIQLNDTSGSFKKGNLYVFVTSTSGKMLANGANARLVGKELMDLKDADGKYFVKNYIDLAEAKGSGWVDYKWINPQTSAIELKSTYVEKVDDLIVGCGIYKS